MLAMFLTETMKHKFNLLIINIPAIMKRKFKRWWSTIPPISTKQKFTSYLNSLNYYVWLYFSFSQWLKFVEEED
jgi:hypothetical protein